MQKPYIAPGAIVRGNVYLGEGSSVFYNAVVRTENGQIHVGEFSNIQDNCVLHVDKGNQLTIGRYVTIGHGAIVHCKSVGDDTLIGMGAILLNGAVVGKNCIVGAGALVTENMVIPDESVVMGQPAKVKRMVTKEDINANHANAVMYVEEAKAAMQEEF